MGFLPSIVHFRAPMYLSLIVGLWPLISPKKKLRHAFYKTMSKLYYVYFRMFIITEAIQLTLLLLKDEVDYNEVTNNLSIVLVYLNSAVRCKVCKGKVIRKMITEVGNFEKKIWQHVDIDIVQIYRDNAKRNTLFCAIFATNTILISIIFTAWPFFAEKQRVEINNATVEVKPLPISAWIPFDVHKHYITAYVLLLFNASFVGTMFFISTEVIAFGLMTYPLGQIRILKHILRNFGKYKNSLQREMSLSADLASERQLKECLFKHRDIIRYIDDFNAEMKHTYLLDFLQCSLQLTCILYRFLSQVNLALIIINVQFLIAMTIRLFITYWTANEIIIQSEALSMELYNMEWLNESMKVKKMILFMMMRSQRPLKLFIGVFKTMSLETFISIIKVTYSYISLFYRHR